MKKKEPIIITEYQRVMPEINGHIEGDGFKSIPKKAYEDLEKFVKEYKDTADYDSLDFFNVGHNHHLGDYISAKNYVGLIELKSAYQIQILPKIELEESIEDTQKVFRRMLSSMKDFPAKVSDNASLKDEKMNLYEIFINMYISEVQRLLKRGLKSTYVSEEDNLNKVKGKILIDKQIKHNLAHKERFFVRFDDYQVDRPENRIIKTTLLKLKTLTNSEMTLSKIRQQLTSFENVQESFNYEKDFSKVNIDRSMKNYENIMRWSRVFLYDKSFTSFSGKTEARALLFPMEKLFEAYVAKELGKVISEEWSLSTQDTGYYLFDKPRIFAIRPDLVLRRNDGKTVVMDTKWKRLNSDASKKYGISQADMYQMYAYSKKYKASDIWVLYPENKEMNNTKDYCFKSSVPEGEDTTIHLFFVNMGENKIQDSMKELFEKVIKHE